MKRINTTKTLLAGAALAGLVSGGFLASAKAASNSGPVKFAKSEAGIDAGVLAEKEKGETHDCAGKNSCKGKGGCAMKDGKPAHPKKDK